MRFFKKIAQVGAVVGMTTGVWYGIKKLTKQGVQGGFNVGKLGVLVGALGLVSSPAYAMNESLVNTFASALSAAANGQNIGQVSQLIDDGAVISLTRQGKTATLDKNAYLQLLQKSWAGAKDYRYAITISDVVISGNQARAQVLTTETWTKDGKKTVITTTSRATLVHSGANALLLRAVSQVTVE